MLRPLFLLPAAFLLLPGARGDERPPAATSFEMVLSDKGLKRQGLSYILKDTESRDRRLGEFAEGLRSLDAEYAPLFAARQRLKIQSEQAEKRIKEAEADVETAKRAREDAKKKASESEEKTAGQKYLIDQQITQVENLLRAAEGAVEAAKAVRVAAQRELSDFESRSQADFKRYEVEHERVRRSQIELIADTARMYENLMNDPEVKGAIRTHNRDRRPKVVLGPASSPEEYHAIISRDALVLLREKGLVFKKDRRRFAIEAEERAVALALTTQKLFERVKTAERAKAPRPSPRDELVARRDKAVAALARAADFQKRRMQAEIALFDQRIKSFEASDADADREVLERAGEAAATRRKFLAALHELRAAVDAVPLARQALTRDAEVRNTMMELLGKGAGQPDSGETKIAELSEFRQAIAALERCEKTIRVELIPNRAQRGGEVIVNAILNGVRTVPMVIKPGVRATRFSRELADEIGASPPPDAPAIDLPTSPGTSVSAVRVVLKSVQLGAFTTGQVPCLILTADNAPGELPVLGQDVLDRFSYEITPEGGLVLTRIDLSGAK